MKAQWIPGGVTAPKGFQAAGTWSGIKRNRRPDLALVVSDTVATAAGMFTTSRIQAAPVHVCRAQLRRGRARAILVNSGCANCLTGQPGARDAQALIKHVATHLDMPAASILVASTGVIGQRLPVARMKQALPRLVGRMGARGHRDAAWAILTTDTHPKEVALEWRAPGGRARLGGMAKGAGMIEPHMATLLAFFTTDVAIARPLLQRALREACDASFHRITVDGDMSTNDTVLIMANGQGGARITRADAVFRAFVTQLTAAAQELSRRLVEDGEGATKIALIRVTGARTTRDADRCARAVANSPLVKTMIAGGDPNIGRVAAAVGSAGVRCAPDRLRVLVNGRTVIALGVHRRLDRKVRHALAGRGPLTIRIDLASGTAAADIWTCDLTAEYIRINTAYTT